MLISIIIPTFNRANQLLTTLQSLVKLKTALDLFEIIIVDNGSTDETKSVIDQFINNNKVVNIKYFYDDIPGLLTGRHRGALEAKGEILSFIDDDVCVSTLWLDSIINVMEERKDISFLTGPNLPLYETYPPEWLNYFWNKAYKGKYCSWLSLLDLGNEIQEIHPNYVWGLNFTIRKNVFLELGGFHPDNIPKKYQKFQGDGETGLTIKAFNKGLKALYHPGVLLYHQIPLSRITIEYFANRAYYQGVCNSFTDLRKKKYSEIKMKEVYRDTFIKKIKCLIRRKVLNTKKENKEKIPVDIENIFIILSKKEKEGFDFHQKMYKENKTIQDWVHQDNFLNYKLPQE